MAQPAHKAATSVTLAPLQERSALENFVHQYWKHGAALAVAVTAAVVFFHQRSQAEREARASSWDTVMTRATLDPFTRTPSADAATWESLASELKGRDSGPWVRLMQAQQLVTERKYDEAKAALAQIKAEYPTHPLVVDTWRESDADGGASLLELIERRLGARASWEAERPTLFANPAPAADAPRVVLNTSKGEIVVALFPSKAPQHVAKFLELVDAKHFDGMAFHEISAGRSISGGDPNTKGEDTATWGQGGTELVLPVEKSGLHHFAGALSADDGPTETQSLAGRFSIYTADYLLDDDVRVVFGAVESGLDVAQQIAASPTDPSAPNRPTEAVRILSATRR